MKVLLALVLGSGLMFGVADAQTSDLPNETPQVEESVNETENQAVEGSNEAVEPNESGEVVETPSEEAVEPTPEQTEFQKLLEMWLNGELVLDDETMSKLEQEILDKIKNDEGFNSLKETLTNYVNEQVDALLQNVIGDEKERQKVASVLSAVLSAISSFVIMLIFTKGIRKEGKRASVNNDTMAQSSKIMNEAMTESKESIKKMEDLVKSDKDSADKLAELVKQSAIDNERWSKAIMGVLQVVYDKEGATDGKQEETPKE